MGLISGLLEDLCEIVIDEASKAALRRRMQATSGDHTTSGQKAQFRFKKAAQAQRKAKRHGPTVRGRRKKRNQAYRDLGREHKVDRLKASLRGSGMG